MFYRERLGCGCGFLLRQMQVTPSHCTRINVSNRYILAHPSPRGVFNPCFIQTISPVQGVEDEHFIVWMRTAALSTFRNLYGRIEHDLEAADSITFNVTASECGLGV